MKATGIVRRIDDLGRVVIPKEIRRTLHIREGDPLEIYVDREGEVILKKYSPISELGDFAKEYAEALHEACGHVAIISDRDVVIAVAGAPKKDYVDKPIPPVVDRSLGLRGAAIVDVPADDLSASGCRFMSAAVNPIRVEGESIGAVALMSKETDPPLGSAELMLIEAASSFLAKQMDR